MPIGGRGAARGIWPDGRTGRRANGPDRYEEPVFPLHRRVSTVAEGLFAAAATAGHGRVARRPAPDDAEAPQGDVSRGQRDAAPRDPLDQALLLPRPGDLADPRPDLRLRGRDRPLLLASRPRAHAGPQRPSELRGDRPRGLLPRDRRGPPHADRRPVDPRPVPPLDQHGVRRQLEPGHPPEGDLRPRLRRDPDRAGPGRRRPPVVRPADPGLRQRDRLLRGWYGLLVWQRG